MPAADVALVTERRYEAPTHVDAYVGNILQEDAIVAAALREQGLTSTRVDWSRDDVDWSSFRCLLLRTMWDYFDRFARFTAWLDAIDGRVPVFNDLPTVRWNLDKRYLLDLRARGIPIVPTRRFERGSAVMLADLVEAEGWAGAVIKPAVSGAARHTHRVRPEAPGEHQATLDALLANEAMLVQPFMPDILAHGEVTVVVMDGRCTHALRKIAAPGDFRVQDDHGGTVVAHTPDDDEIALAERAMAAVDPVPAYGRVDMVRDPDGRPVVMELELVEPELWVRLQPSSAAVLAAGLRRRLDAR